ncbi:class F sortase [Actinomadura rubrisoli]|uniref:Class F sortase n=1 Tax=Actinomadura rubrisoli TaxID=2530368 RepID=A0A4R5B3B1_9ACTN|nr:class F sortase [Actinomadura rubrisoli]TDD79483.1 class F sortase [Actinomadura rubrisoli]
MRERRAALALLGAVALAGCGGGPSGDWASSDRAPRAGWSPVPGQVAAPDAGRHAAGRAERHAEPVEVRIPALGVHSRLERLATGGGGELVPPRDPATAGWYAAGIRPGDAGPAVIAGHLDARTGPGVFAGLAGLRPGAAVLVKDARGRTSRFTVDAVRTYPKARFPTAEVYGPTPDPQLRLITCAGAFDRSRRHYLDNVVAYATMG